MPNTNVSTGEWTNASLLLKYEEKLALDINLKEAVAYARAHQLGARKTITKANGMFPGVTYNMIHNALSGRAKRASGKRLEYDILTEVETEQLIKWIKESAINKDAPNDDEVSQKLVDMLKARSIFNKLKRHSVKAGAIPLTRLEARLVKNTDASISHVFLQHLSARFPEIQKKCENNIDATRAKKMNEHVIDKHFHGGAGLKAAMLHHGIMDPTTEFIIDPRRVWALDELGQFFEHGGVGPRPIRHGAYAASRCSARTT